MRLIRVKGKQKTRCSKKRPIRSNAIVRVCDWVSIFRCHPLLYPSFHPFSSFFSPFHPTMLNTLKNEEYIKNRIVTVAIVAIVAKK